MIKLKLKRFERTSHRVICNKPLIMLFQLNRIKDLVLQRTQYLADSSLILFHRLLIVYLSKIFYYQQGLRTHLFQIALFLRREINELLCWVLNQVSCKSLWFVKGGDMAFGVEEITERLDRNVRRVKFL